MPVAAPDAVADKPGHEKKVTHVKRYDAFSGTPLKKAPPLGAVEIPNALGMRQVSVPVATFVSYNERFILFYGISRFKSTFWCWSSAVSFERGER